MARFAEFGSNLYTGKTSIPFVPKRRLWLGIAAALVVISLLIPVLGGGLKFGIDFRGGSEFTVSDVANSDVKIGEQAVADNAQAEHTEVTNIAPGTIRVQTDQLDDAQTLAVKQALKDAYHVTDDEVTSSFVGPSWGAGVTRQATWGLIAFVALATVGMALYFRTVKMSLSAIAGLLFTVITTLGVYAACGFEITPSAIIGFLTILSYSLYDSVVVFDKIRENTQGWQTNRRRTFAEEVNLAVNQTLVRSINTSVVGILPVGSILFIGAFLLGAGTLQDLSLSLFIGIIMGTLGTLFVSAPLYAVLRGHEAGIREQTAAVLTARENGQNPEEEAQPEASETTGSGSHRAGDPETGEEEQALPVPRFEPQAKGRPDNGAVV